MKKRNHHFTQKNKRQRHLNRAKRHSDYYLSVMQLCLMLAFGVSFGLIVSQLYWTPSVQEELVVESQPEKNVTDKQNLSPTKSEPAVEAPPSDVEIETKPEIEQKPKEVLLEKWQKNSRKLKLNSSQPIISVVIDDLGMSISKTNQFIEFHKPLTLAFLPYAPQLKKQTQKAIQAGHELIVHVPMEPHSDIVNPGPNVLLSSMDSKKFIKQVEHDLSTFEGHIGINNHMGSKLTEDLSSMELVMKCLKKEGLIFLDSRTTAMTVTKIAAEKHNVPHIERDVFIDHERSKEAIEQALLKLENEALTKGFAVGIGHPYDETLEALEGWLPEIQKRGFVIAPLSASYLRQNNKTKK